MEEVNALMTPQAAADYLQCSYRTILKWIESGDLGCYKIGDGRSIRISMAQIQEYLKSHKADPIKGS